MTPAIPPDEGRSWWLREALALPEFSGDPCPPLTGDVTADVVILGGGYTGMWTAYHLKQIDPGIDVVVLEADICGGGPSGRNGGFVNSWWSSLSELCERFGDDAALALCRAGSASVAALARFCNEDDVDAWFTPAGDLGVATSDGTVGAWDDNVAAAERLGVADTFTVLSPDELRARCDSPLFRGGVFDHDAATVQPARLARGLRRVLLERGVRIHERTPVTRFGVGGRHDAGGRSIDTGAGRGAPAVAESPRGSVRAGAAVIALNAWASSWRRFRRLLTVRGTYIVLTASVPEELERIGWTGGEGIWDFRAALHYLRTTPDGRIAFGLGGMQPGLTRTIGPRFAHDERGLRICAADLRAMFPSFRDVPLEAAWGGPVDVAGHHLPFVGSFDDDTAATAHYGLGFTGNGVAPCHLVGRILAGRVIGTREEALESLPIVTERPMRFPPEPILSPGALVANAAIRRRDEAMDRGHDPGPLTEFVARLPRRLGYNLGP